MFCNVKKIEMLFENIVKKNKRKSQSIWEIHFSDLFDIEDKYIDGKSDLLFKSNFRERWRELCKYRNHIAHNKFIDSIFYRDLEKLINELKCKIDEAEKEFSLLIENEKKFQEKIYQNHKNLISNENKKTQDTSGRYEIPTFLIVLMIGCEVLLDLYVFSYYLDDSENA